VDAASIAIDDALAPRAST